MAVCCLGEHPLVRITSGLGLLHIREPPRACELAQAKGLLWQEPRATVRGEPLLGPSHAEASLNAFWALADRSSSSRGQQVYCVFSARGWLV